METSSVSQLSSVSLDFGPVSFGPHLHNSNTRLAILISNLIYSIPVTVYLDLNPIRPSCFESALITSWPNLSATKRDAALYKILSLLRARYASTPPAFGMVPFVTTSPSSSLLVITEKLDPRVKLSPPPEAPLPLPRYPAPELVVVPFSPTSPKSWSSQIALVQLTPTAQPIIAKGLSSELQVLLNLPLPQHKNIIPPPLGLITVSPTDERTLGFLLPYYPFGSLDDYAQRNFPNPAKLAAWALQLCDAARWLHRHGSFHGDIKPDNIVVSGVDRGEENLMLIDFSQDAFTAATAAPELMRGLKVCPRTHTYLHSVGSGSQGEGEGLEGMKNWPQAHRERAEVFAIGRTLHILASRIGMTELYMRLYSDTGYKYRTDWGGVVSDRAGSKLRRLVEGCTREKPEERWGLGECVEFLQQDGVEDEGRNSEGAGDSGVDGLGPARKDTAKPGKEKIKEKEKKRRSGRKSTPCVIL